MKHLSGGRTKGNRYLCDGIGHSSEGPKTKREGIDCPVALWKDLHFKSTTESTELKVERMLIQS